MDTLFLPDTDQNLTSEKIDTYSEASTAWLMNFNSERTRDTYKRAVRDFWAFAGIPPHEATQADVIAFKNDLGERLSPATVNLKLSAVSSLCDYLVNARLMEANPCEGVKRHNVNPYGKATYLDSKEGQDLKLLDEPDRETLKGKRDYAIMLILLTTGVRVSAVADARVRDLVKHATGYRLAYVNKAGESETAQLEPFVYEAIQDYLIERGDKRGNDPLFMTVKSNRTGHEVKPMTRHAISAVIRRYAKQAGLHHVTAHSLRHTVAMNASEHGTMAEVSRLMKHKSMRVTTIYLDHVQDSDVRELSKKLGERYQAKSMLS